MKQKTLEEVQKYEKQKKEVDQENETKKGKIKVKKKKNIRSFLFSLILSAACSKQLFFRPH